MKKILSKGSACFKPAKRPTRGKNIKIFLKFN